MVRIAATDLDSLMSGLEVSFVKLAECLVSPGWSLLLPQSDAPGIHYNLKGTGTMTVGDGAPIALRPHTLIVVPPRQPFRIDVADAGQASCPSRTVDGRARSFAPGAVRRQVAGNDPHVMLICGYFQASYGTAVHLFEALRAPIVEQFGAPDRIDQKLTEALHELEAQEAGSGAMTAALMKQVLVVILRRSLKSTRDWVERFAILSDPNIARAFADMVARPGATHSVQSLSDAAYLSRSAFMVRFRCLFGRAPMEVLRELRMRQAALLLTANELPIEQIALAVGYASRSSFLRAFRKAYGSEPSDYRRALAPMRQLACSEP